MSSDEGRRVSRSRSRSPYRGRSRSRSPVRFRNNRDNRECPSPSKCLGVFGLNLRTTSSDLEKEFNRVADVESVNLVMDRRSISSRGFAFIYFRTTEDAARAKEAMGGKELDGRCMRVDYSVTKRAHTPTPGRYMGRRSPPRLRRRSRSPPFRQRSPSPYRRRSRSPRYRGRSPHRRRSPSPYYRNRSPSPYNRRQRSPSPYYNRRSPSPYYARRSPSPRYRRY